MSQTPTYEKQKSCKGSTSSSPQRISQNSRQRKLSEPIKQSNMAAATLEETLHGLQKVSDMLQASLKDLEIQHTDLAAVENSGYLSPPVENAGFLSPPVPPLRTSSSPGAQKKFTENSENCEIVKSCNVSDVEKMDSAEMLRSNQPIVQLRSKLSEEMFGTIESNDTKQW